MENWQTRLRGTGIVHNHRQTLNPYIQQIFKNIIYIEYEESWTETAPLCLKQEGMCCPIEFHKNENLVNNFRNAHRFDI